MRTERRNFALPNVGSTGPAGRKVRVTKNVQRELECQALLERMLAGQKLTFLFDVDETLVQTHYGSLDKAQRADDLKSSFSEWVRFHHQHLYPTSLAIPKTIQTLHNLGQGVGIFSKAGIVSLLRLKVLGVDFKDVDFLGFHSDETLNESDISCIKEILGLSGNHFSIDDIIKAFEDEHKLQIVTGTFGRDK